MWNKPYLALLFSPTVANYSDTRGLNAQGYGVMPKVEQTLASYLSPDTASSLKAPTLPTKPCRGLCLILDLCLN